jgi:M3 family oligoendopeptidase
MTFEKFVYTRPDMAKMTQEYDKHITALEMAKTPAAQHRTLMKINQLRSDFQTMCNICYIRQTANTADEFYKAEKDYFDANVPAYEALYNRYCKVLLKSPFRQVLEDKYGPQLFNLAEMAIKTFNDDILEDLKSENTLSTGYTQKKAQAQIPFDGQTCNLSGIHVHEISSDRNTRKQAALAKWAFYEKNNAFFEDTFDQMVKHRHKMAKSLGFKNFVEVGYARMRRSDYTPDMVANFRKQVRELIVPITVDLYERQRNRLGIDKIRFYDEEYKYTSGNPKPKGTPQQIIDNAALMYRELSPDTHSFFSLMQSANLMDLVNRDNKAVGGYCTYIPQHKAPFIYSNFNGTSRDIDVLTHEAGHAFQVWSSSEQIFEEYHWPTYEAAEIHSMSMEFFTWPWMDLFFEEETNKYKFMHMAGALHFLPYGVAVDEFQHIVYENPDMTPSERNTAWRELEKTYLPVRDYDGFDYLEKGRLWQGQNHIFNAPFYYIDYTLAQICAFQFWVKDQNHHETAWHDYLRLCRAGGSRSFLGLVELAHLRSPFDDGSVESVVSEIQRFLNSVNDAAF